MSVQSATLDQPLRWSSRIPGLLTREGEVGVVEPIRYDDIEGRLRQPDRRLLPAHFPEVVPSVPVPGDLARMFADRVLALPVRRPEGSPPREQAIARIAANLILLQFAGIPGRWLQWAANLGLRLVALELRERIENPVFRDAVRMLEAHHAKLTGTLLAESRQEYLNDAAWMVQIQQAMQAMHDQSAAHEATRETLPIVPLLANIVAQQVHNSLSFYKHRNPWELRGVAELISIMLLRERGARAVAPFMQRWLEQIERTLPMRLPSRNAYEAVVELLRHDLMELPGEYTFEPDHHILTVEVDLDSLQKPVVWVSLNTAHLAETAQAIRETLMQLGTPAYELQDYVVHAALNPHIAEAALEILEDETPEAEEAREMLDDNPESFWHSPSPAPDSPWRVEFRKAGN